MLLEIKNDLYDIADRLKEVHPDYKVYFDTALQKFVLYANGKRQLVFPFENLDARAVEYAEKTSVKYADEIVRELDEGNERYQRDRVARVQDYIEDEFSHRLRVGGG